MLLIGLTGNIASGKSTVARLLSERGATIIDADVLARRVVEPGMPAFDEIVRRWAGNAPPAEFTAQWEVIAVAGDAAVVHWVVSFRDRDAMTTMDGVLIVRFDEHGCCREHREWYVEQRA